MKLLTFEQLSSTSDHALQLLANHTETAPFAVLSRSQTKGRGRSGRSWESQLGGLYLSLVIDPVAAERLNQLPICVAIAVAYWILNRFKIRLTIKWPNDLLFGGAKIGGILCESSVHGNRWGPLVIGIGINLDAPPQVGDQRTIGLKQLGPVTDDALDLAADLAISVQQQLQDLQLIAHYPRFCIEEGQLWVNDRGEFAQSQGLDTAGQLQLRDLQQAETQTLSSVRHDWRWIYQEPERYPLLTLDIGNTLCKLGIFAPASREEPELLRFTLQHQDAGERRAIAARLSQLQLPRDWPVHAIAVRDALLEPLKTWLASLGLRLQLVPKRSLCLDYSAYRFDDLGIDRLALAEGAWSDHKGQNLLLVSAGTAVTIEVIRADAVYCGGYILPGLQTKLSALHLRTGRLPQIQLKDIDARAIVEQKLLGDDTRSAMLRGVLRETELALRGLLGALKAEGGFERLHIICTGGDGEFLSRLLEAPYDPHLILKGVKALVLGGVSR